MPYIFLQKHAIYALSKVSFKMSVFQDYTLNQNDYIIKFGCNGGMSVVRGACYDKIINMSAEKLPLLFQPVNARTFRQFGLETIVNCHVSNDRRSCIHDLINLTELSMSISCMQFKDKLIAKNVIREVEKNVKLRSKMSKVFLDMLVEMFLNNQIGVSIIHPIQFSKFFNLIKEDSLITVVKTVHKKLDLIYHIHLVGLGGPNIDKVGYFVNKVFPSIVRVLNPGVKEGRLIRGRRELVKHKREIAASKPYDFTDEEVALITKLLDEVIARAEKDDEEDIS